MRSMLLVFTVVLAAQAQSPASPVVRGVLLERDPQTATGEFSVRGEDSQVFRYHFDAATYVERDQQSIDVARLRTGETVEVVSGEGPATSLRYARTVRVIEDPPPVHTISLRPAPGGAGSYRMPVERLLPASMLSFSGVIFRLNGERLALHTHQAGDQTILLRQDTRYLQDGESVQANQLQRNMRVFVRAGRNLYDELEAYQVVWGHILMPR
jgi:hypothetical protein